MRPLKQNVKIYNLRIVPPEPIFSEVVSFKKQFISTFGKQPLSKSKPHITLAIFEMDPREEEHIINVFSPLGKQDSFMLDVDGFGTFDGKNANVLLLKIPMTKALEQIYDQLKMIKKSNYFVKQIGMIIPGTPHMTISKTVDKATLQASLDMFHKTPYSRSFLVDRLVLTSRPYGKTWDWSHDIMLNKSIG